MDNVHMPFETVLDYSLFSVRVREADVERTDAILRNISVQTRRKMRKVMGRIWLRFTYSQAVLDARNFLARLPHDYLEAEPLPALREAMDQFGPSVPDALDTIMMALYDKLPDATSDS